MEAKKKTVNYYQGRRKRSKTKSILPEPPEHPVSPKFISPFSVAASGPAEFESIRQRVVLRTPLPPVLAR